MITEFIGDCIVRLLAPTFAKNAIKGIIEFNKHCFPMPARCKAKHWMRRGEERIDMHKLFPKELSLSEEL